MSASAHACALPPSPAPCRRTDGVVGHVRGIETLPSLPRTAPTRVVEVEDYSKVATNDGPNHPPGNPNGVFVYTSPAVSLTATSLS